MFDRHTQTVQVDLSLTRYIADPQHELEQLRHTLHMLRKVLHCTLPIELYHATKDVSERSLREELVRRYNIIPKRVESPRRSGKVMSELRASFLAQRLCLSYSALE
jgi:hypothetical protein